MSYKKPVFCLIVFFMILESIPTALAADEFSVFKVNVERLSNYKSSERAKAQKAFDYIEQIVNTDEFKTKVLEFSWKDPKSGKTQNQFHMNDGLSNAQVLDKILKGAELAYNTQENNTMDLNLRMYWAPFSKVIGYTTPDSDTVNNNRKYFKRMNIAELAGHYFHEWLHKVGFDHEFNYTAQRPYSVPYAVGTIIEEIAREL